VGAVIIGLRPGDHKDLNQIAERVGRPAKEVAGILLEQAIRRESGNRLTVTAPRAEGAPA
jgi:hypothetical protein